MAEFSSAEQLHDEALLKMLASRRPEIGIPGYWETLASNCEQWALEIFAGPFWSESGKRLDQWRTEYKQRTTADLLAQAGLPSFVAKSAESTKSKVFRKCRADTKAPEELFSTTGAAVPVLGDLVRARIVCRYIDGVEFLASKMEALAQEMNLTPKRDREGRLEGYFAQHLTVDAHVYYRLGGESQPAKIRFEVQLASELATTMWNSSHPFYKFAQESSKPAESWQWNPKDPQFIANQLGHVIHLADGLIVQLRSAKETRD
jgi:hypothetical protein